MTWRLGVVGSPIGHSLTPRLHRAALGALGIAGRSETCEVGAGDAAGLARAVGDHDALSVTMPHKESVLALCDEVDRTARRIRSVNSVLVRGGVVAGRSTDGAGFLGALASDFALEVGDRPALVLGTGGAARAIVDALAEEGARVTVAGRNAAAAAEIARGYPNVSAWGGPLADVALTVNATPPAAADPPALAGGVVTYATDAVAVDLSYEPATTPWLAARVAGGLRCANGLSLLVHQAQLQMEWWFERPVPLSALVAAVAP